MTNRTHAGLLVVVCAADYYAIRISGPPFLQGSFFVGVTDDDSSSALGWQGRPAFVEQLSPSA